MLVLIYLLILQGVRYSEFPDTLNDVDIFSQPWRLAGRARRENAHRR